MLNHLYAAYGKMTPQDLQQLDEDMKRPYNPTLPIENLFDQIEIAKDLAQAANAPYAEAQLLNIACNLVFQSSFFPETCCEWRKLPNNQKTWLQFKTMFMEAHQDFQDTSTQGQSPYHPANAAIQHDESQEQHIFSNEAKTALVNLAAATATD